MENAEKKLLRAEFAARRARLSTEDRLRLDRKIRENIRRSAEYADSNFVAIFATDGYEPDLLPLLAADPEKTFMLPRYDATARGYVFAAVRSAAELTAGRYRLPEPGPEAPVFASEVMLSRTLYLVPGLAFDTAGVRLGRGGGFYDRLLTGVRSPVSGVYYGCQRAASLPCETHDRRLDGVYTESGWEKF